MRPDGNRPKPTDGFRAIVVRGSQPSGYLGNLSARDISHRLADKLNRFED